ncbi:hypothetical protein C5167_017063 [Papaver somniferum]|uniref:DUF4378 domain-containing protein n=1 Tax=Papaver somniferum TaxID=3469 RepID=A0A4Y7IMF0_PAPSO|nr:hypothetical protein C5167_017063 [Papaver somniferum]
MGGQKQGSKGGGGRYVGGFLQLFDWNGKSRKKLFSNKSPEGSKQGKRSEGNSTTSQLSQVDDDFYGRSTLRERSDYSCASSVTDEDGYGTKAPGVVARLMGLDCLPTSDIAEPYSSPLSDSRSLQDFHYRRTPEVLYGNEFVRSGYQCTESERYAEKPVEMRPQHNLNRPIDRFQSEVLPPRSVKAISITHHKLLSPIKNPGFIPSKAAAQIMEEASRIIGRGHQVTNRNKMPSLGSPSVPIKIRDLKEKMEASQRPSKLPESSRRSTESNAAKYLKGQSMNKSWNGSDDVPQVKSSTYSDESHSAGLKTKGKSVSLAVQAKVNVQRREALSSTSSRSVTTHKDRHEFKSNKPIKSQMNAQNSTRKKPALDRTSGVLRQNNQKQNSQTIRDRPQLKPSVPHQQGRKPLSSSSRDKAPSKVAGTSKVGVRRTVLESDDHEKEAAASKTKNVPRKKRPIESDSQFEKSNFSDTGSVDRDQLPRQSNAALDAQLKRAYDHRGSGMDVVSFTFTSPLKRPCSGSQSSGQVVERNINFCTDSNREETLTDVKYTRSPSLGLNGIGGDALSVLLEQKIKELTFGVESSSRSKSRSDVTSVSCSQSDSNCSSIDWHKLQVGGKQCSSVEAELQVSSNCPKKFPSVEFETELSDSASFPFRAGVSCEQTITFGATDYTRSDKWELEYVREILSNVELMFKDFTLGRAREIINPHLFDQLESRKYWPRVSAVEDEKESKLRRRTLFDCVGECLDLRCRRYVGGGSAKWAKGLAMVRRTDWLANEVYKEVSVWRAMDDVVDKDMSSQFGRWLEFEPEEFEVGLDVEKRILSSLVDELVVDMFY